MATLLTEEMIAEKLPRISGWELRGREIAREFQFADFKAALQFVNLVARLAEAVNHHPDIDIRWNKVLLRLVTHSKGGLTDNDFALAAEINGLKAS